MATLNFTLEDVGPYKSVNGEEVLMTDEERQALADEWNENASRVVVPKSVPIRKAIKVMRKYGILASFQSLLDAMTGPEGEDARTDWEKSSEVDTSNPTFQLGVQLLGLTEQQVNAMLIEADALP